MKKLFFTISFLFAFIIYTNNAFAKDECSGEINSPTRDTLINYGDNINIPIKVYVVNQRCYSCIFQYAYWSLNGQTLSLTYPNNDTCYYVIQDTGTYNLTVGTVCNNGSVEWYFTINVHYRSATPVIEVINPNAFQIYPTVSTGIFYVKANDQNKLKKIQILDGLGRIVFADSRNDAEINLRDFSNGISWYAIEDNKERIYRGRLVKE